MGYRRVSYTEQCWYIVKYAISAAFRRLRKWRHKNENKI